MAATWSTFDRVLLEPVEDRVRHHFSSLPHAATLLDVGCGDGNKTAWLARPGVRVAGMDIDPERVREARLRHPGPAFLRGDVTRLPLRDGALDALFSCSVLQYADHDLALAECRRVLRKGGRAVFIENLEGHPAARFYRWLHQRMGWRHPVHATPRRHLSWGAVERFSAFGQVRLEPFNLTTLAVIPFYLRWPGSAHRFAPVHRLLVRLDRALIAVLPFLRRYCWTLLVLASDETVSRDGSAQTA